MDRIFLLADDDHDEAELFGEALSMITPRVLFHHVPDGRGVLHFLHASDNKTPDIIFLDLNMPVVDGWQCLSSLKGHGHFCTIPVIIYTTSSRRSDMELALANGACGFLTKPSNFKELVNILHKIANTTSTELEHILIELSK